MARGKYLSLEEARRLGQIDQFCKEHPSRGKWKDFDALMDAFCGSDAKSSSRAVRTMTKAKNEETEKTKIRNRKKKDSWNE